MAMLVRFIPSRAKWLKHDELKQALDFDCRALRDLLPRESEARVSVFLAANPDEALNLAVLWAITQKELQNEDYILIDEAIALDKEMGFTKTPGNTGVKVLDDHHYELTPRGGLSVAEVISQVVWSENAVFRLGKSELRRHVERNMQSGVITPDEMNPMLRVALDSER